MIIVLLLMLAGIFIGWFLKHHPKLIKLNDQLILYAIYLLLFLLGVSVGLNKQIIQNIAKIGVQSLIITVGAISGSVIVLAIIYRFAFKVDLPKGDDHEK